MSFGVISHRLCIPQISPLFCAPLCFHTFPQLCKGKDTCPNSHVGTSAGTVYMARFLTIDSRFNTKVWQVSTE